MLAIGPAALRQNRTRPNFCAYLGKVCYRPAAANRERMIFMKKLLALLLAGAMAFSMAACSSSGSPSSTGGSGESTAAEGESQASGQLIVGSITDLNADFMDGWTNGTPNKSVKNLLYGYATATFTQDGSYAVDPVVVKDGKAEITENEDGSKTYTYTLNENLTYNDGSPITAKDYVFAVLLGSSPAFGELDANNTVGADFVGFDAFNSGESKVFTGVRLLGDYQFSVTLDAESLPNYYELALTAVAPYPMDVLAPGVDILDDGEGAYFTDNFSVDLIRDPITNTETGYRYNPKKTSGPYQFESFDPGTKQAVLTVNPNYLGAYDGAKPSIQTLILKSVTDATQMDELAAGSVDLISGVSGGTAINAGLDLVDEGKASYADYMRAGYGKITFACDFGPTQFPAVRQAIAYLLDRNEFASQYSGGYARVVNGYYGLSQWEYRENREALESELNPYTYNPEKAKELLIADGWTKNESGGDFVEGVDTLRYKEVDGELMPLTIKWANTPNNPVSDLLNTMLPSEMEKVGMKLEPTTMEFGNLQNYMLRNGEEATYHMFNLAAGFATVNAIWYYYSSDPAYMGIYNQNFIVDEELEKLSQELRATEPGDEEAWSAKWLEFQKRWNELLPDIPLYSDNYHDFFTTRLQNYTPDGLWSWEYAILRANLEG